MSSTPTTLIRQALPGPQQHGLQVSSILVCHLPKSAKHTFIVEFSDLKIAGAAVRYSTSMAKYLPKRLRALYRSGGARAVSGFTSSYRAINEIEG